MTDTKTPLKRLQKNQNVDRVTVDLSALAVGTGPAIGLAYAELKQGGAIQGVTDPVHQIVSLTVAGAHSVGSDYAMCGLVFENLQPEKQARFTDPLGVTWDWDDLTPMPVVHPLDKSSFKDIAKLGKPKFSGRVQFPARSTTKDNGMAVICAPPMPGLLELCFRMRGRQRFLEDITTVPKTANALLDWATDVIGDSYRRVLDQFPEAPDFIVYGDDLGHQLGLFVSEDQFKTYLKPRMATIVNELRGRCSCGIAYRSSGAISPLLKDLSDLDLSLLSVQPAAAGMRIEDVRGRIPESMILHGVTDFAALRSALRDGRADALLDIAYSLAMAWPVIAAPSDKLPPEITRADIAWAADFLKTLDLGKKASRSEILLEGSNRARSVIAKAKATTNQK